MADQENVRIRLTTTANTRGINQTQRSLNSLNATSATTQARLNAIGAANTSNTNAVNAHNKALQNQQRIMRRTQTLFSSFTKLLMKGFKLAMKGALIETVAYAAALSSVNLLLKSGAGLVKAYNATLTGLGVAAANATAGVAAFVAIFTQAMRQFAAAQSSASYGGNFAGASQALRTMQSDTQLAVFGLQSLNSAFAAASKNAKITGASVASIRGLSDFAVASGDMEKGLIAAANLVTLLQSGKGAGTAEVLNVAKELGPEFEKAFKKATSSGKKSNKDLLAMFASGELSQAAGIAGTAANVRGSLMGQLKTFAAEFQVLFADIGQSFIGPTQRTFDELTRIFRRTVVQISGQLNIFANGPFQNVIVAGFDRLGTFTARLVNEYLPRTEEVLGKIADGWTRISSGTKNTFTRLERFLKRFSEASAEINKFFGGIFRTIGSEFKQGFEGFGQLVIDNRDEFQQFGVAIQNLIKSLFDFSRAVREAFFNALPAITGIVDSITQLAGALQLLISAISSLGPTGSLIGFGSLFLGGKAFGARNKPGGAAGFLSQNKNFLAAGAMAIPSMMPGLGAVGDIATAAMLGGFGGSKIKGIADARYAKAVAAVAQQNAAIQAANATKLPYQMQPLLSNPTRKMKPLGRFGAGARLIGAGAVAAGGSMATNYAIDFMEGKFSNTAANIGTGIAGGAATGAGIGALLAPFSLGLSVAIGAVAGAIIGGFTGWVKSGEAKKKARQAGSSFAGGYADEITKLVQTGNIKEAEAAIATFGNTIEEVSEKVTRSSEFRAAGEEEFKRRMDVVQPAVDMFNRNLRDLTEVTGLAEEQIISTAMAAEVDLSSSLLDLQGILSATGLAVGRFGQDFNNAISMALGESVSGIQRQLQILQSPSVLNEAALGFSELAEAGTVTDEDRARLLSTVFEQATLIYGNDPLRAAEYVRENIGTRTAPGLQFTTAGGPLSGLQADFFGGGGEQLLQAGYAPIADALRTTIVENVISAVAAGGGTVQRTSIENALRGMSFEELSTLGRQVSREGFLTGTLGMVKDEDGTRSFVSAGAENQLLELIGKQIDITQSESSQITESIDGLGLILDPLKTAIDNFNANIQDLIDAVKTGDTYSPRRNLVSTMSKHNRFDGMIAGKRSVTSSMRNMGLGSPSSDHAFGLAYDLTGQNLGLYQTAVRAGGGYAEFHGAGGSRHLHVVPGDAPIGDTATPVVPMRQMSGGSYSSADSYTINVYPTEGMSPAEIADAVMEKIKREQRSARERN